MFRTSNVAVCALTVAAVFAFSAFSAKAAFLTVSPVSSEDSMAAAIGSAQISIEVENGGTDAVTGDTLLEFSFHVDGPDQMAITQVYFEGGFLDMIVSIDDSDPGVSYEIDRGPPVLPGGKSWGFVATDGLRAGAKPPTRHSGIDPGEWMTVTVSLHDGFTFADAVSALVDGSMRIGMHVQAFPDGSSLSFINDPLVPAPGGVAVLGLTGLLAGGRRRR